MLDNIPAEMRVFNSWVVWRLEDTESGRPTKIPYNPVTGYPAKSTDESTWVSYETAKNEFLNNPTKWSGIGFVLSERDPYGFIDLDKPKNPDGSALDAVEFDKRIARQKSIFNAFDSYAELSPSGEGLHIIVKATLPNGRKRSSIEVYTNQRFMTMTGNVYRNASIVDYNELLNSLWAEMGKGQVAVQAYAGMEQATMSPDEVFHMASTASNSEKFLDLFVHGNWQKYYPSQSEADFALVDILAFYSKNRAQVKMMFLASKLAEREKSRAEYRIGYMLNRCFDNMLPPVDFEGLRNQVNEAIEKAKIYEYVPPASTKAIEIDVGREFLNLGNPALLKDDPNFIYNPPPGLLGEIAQYIYAQSPIPVPEIALAGAIGLMSGICGKAFNISGTGLNQYTLLLAATGTGKESAAGGIGKLISEIVKHVPPAGEFIGPSSISSPQALSKALSNTPCIVSVVGEFGLYLKQMGADNASPHMLGLKSMILDLYNKSGEGAKLGNIVYSDKEKNTTVISSPSFSIFCESAPEPFYETLTESMISGGLLPRFTIIEYHGDRLERNKGAGMVKPSQELIQQLCTLCASTLGLIHQKKVNHVQIAPDAEKILDKFEKLAHSSIVGSMELRRQLWNRAHIKVLKLASLVAVGMHPFEPIIDAEAAKWAIRIVEADVKNMLSRFESGEVGVNNGENKQLQLVTKAIKKYVMSAWSEVEKSAGEKNRTLHAERVIPYSYIQRCTATAGPFKNDKIGATNALKRTLKTMVDSGDLQQMQRADLVKKFGTYAEAYAISSPSTFGI